MPVKIAVIGVGHLGRHHVKHYKKLKNTNLIGIYDKDKKRGNQIGTEFGVKLFDSLKTLVKKVDAVSIVTPTPYHGEIAEFCIKNNKHVFIEKPITEKLEQADYIIKLAKENSIIIQVGHIERLNPALIALKGYPIKPKFIEIQRLAPYTIRGTDVPVVLDKMIHDIDIILSLVNSNVQSIQATGLSILTRSVDIAHARLRFKNGTVASIMSSRISQFDVRKVKIFQKNLYATLDLLKGLTEIYKIERNTEHHSRAQKVKPFNYQGNKQFITYEKPTIKKHDPLKTELFNFVQSVQGLETPIVSGNAGREALAVALEIQKMIIKDIN